MISTAISDATVAIGPSCRIDRIIAPNTTAKPDVSITLPSSSLMFCSTDAIRSRSRPFQTETRSRAGRPAPPCPTLPSTSVNGRRAMGGRSMGASSRRSGGRIDLGQLGALLLGQHRPAPGRASACGSAPASPACVAAPRAARAAGRRSSRSARSRRSPGSSVSWRRIACLDRFDLVDRVGQDDRRRRPASEQLVQVLAELLRLLRSSTASRSACGSRIRTGPRESAACPPRRRRRAQLNASGDQRRAPLQEARQPARTPAARGLGRRRGLLARGRAGRASPAGPCRSRSSRHSAPAAPITPN